MKPKEYIEKLDILKGWNVKKQNELVSFLTSEFLAQLEYFKAENNIKGFDNALKVIRMKWDSISNKIPYGLPEKLWNYFFATVVAPARENLCPSEMERRRKEAAEKRAYYERQKALKREREEEYQRFEEEVRRSFYERLAMFFLILKGCPVRSFSYFGLDPHQTSKSEIMKIYKEKALLLHPDRGGSQEEFVKLIEHKNNCLKWLELNG